MRIVACVVHRHVLDRMYLMWDGRLTFNTDNALLFPGAATAQAALEGYLARWAREHPTVPYTAVEDLDNEEAGPLEPVWTGP